MRARTTLPQPYRAASSDLRVATRAFLALQESHGIAANAEGNCHAHDLVNTWAQLTDQPMPISDLRQELRERMCVDQRAADIELAIALLRGDVRLARLPKRARR